MKTKLTITIIGEELDRQSILKAIAQFEGKRFHEIHIEDKAVK